MGDFSKILKELREDKGWTQDECAKRMGITRSRLSMYEQGKREPDFEMQELIADTFNVDIDYLLGRKTNTTVLQTDYQLFSVMFGKNKADVMEMVKNMDEDQVERTLQMIKVMFPNIKGGDEK